MKNAAISTAHTTTHITTHILDISRGLPAASVAVRLEFEAATGWELWSETSTDVDGRARLLPAVEDFEMGHYRLTFEVGAYFDSIQTTAFYPTIQIVFAVRDARPHHVPLLLSPFGYSTYRGS